MLQRLPKILEVTAHSYGLDLEARTRKPEADGERPSHKRQKSAQDGKPVAQR
ncbi:MAG TPA: hypothetical protein VLK85_36645 [Ramlibacter sp.]|nr:hypothetical protein [Ramlibacter sp.]